VCDASDATLKVFMSGIRKYVEVNDDGAYWSSRPKFVANGFFMVLDTLTCAALEELRRFAKFSRDS
jgi:hypothetical protein